MASWKQFTQGLAARLGALEYSSGGRDITALCTGVESGRVLLSRVGSTVTVVLYDVVVPGSGWTRLCGLPVGFRPVIDVRRDLPYAVQGQQWAIYTSGSLYINAGTGVRKDSLTYGTANPPPAEPPGTAA